MISRHLALAIVSAMLMPQAIEAGSIYGRAPRRARSLYADDTARYFGDIVTIVINEESKVEQGATRSLTKKTSRTGSSEGTLQLRDLFRPLGDRVYEMPLLELTTSSDQKHNGASDYEKENKLTDKITVAVEDVLPNGNLVVLGKRTRKIDGDTQVVQVSGVLRPSDIDFNNEIDSEKIADFHIVYSESGMGKYVHNPGWLAKLLNLINPF